MVGVAVICPSEIAYRRFMPALTSVPECSFVGIGVNSFEERFGTDEQVANRKQKDIMKKEQEKAGEFLRVYGGRLFQSYEEVVSSPIVDAVYIPLPPALHYHWAVKALERGKHVLVEKPAVLKKDDAARLVALAASKEKALHENYMFAFHAQLDAIKEYLDSGLIGEIRLVRIAFGFPLRAADDFRYSKQLGGGALIDCGGYTIKYASMLLGDSMKIVQATKNGVPGYEVDMYGSGVVVNDRGLTAHIAYGMDNDYRCELEVWGSRGTLYTDRVLTAPAGYVPHLKLRFNGREENLELPADDTFKKSITYFIECIETKDKREDAYTGILKQAGYIEDFNRLAGATVIGQE